MFIGGNNVSAALSIKTTNQFQPHQLESMDCDNDVIDWSSPVKDPGCLSSVRISGRLSYQDRKMITGQNMVYFGI
jgi:hypothetical protein